jgi:tRNA A-37 threonylcarbamoyl transferase component Bud32
MEQVLPPPGFVGLELCGSGATSHVFSAVDRKNGGRRVALKRLHRQLARNDEAVARMKRELDALMKLHHPGIVPVRDVIRWQGQPTIVMDFIDGVDLVQRRREVGRIAPEEATRIARELLDVLVATHGAGIVHRDVKPHNVRIGTDGRVYLLDFGSARLDAASALTATGTTVGTPEYMAPELFVGSVYDPRVDLYGLGALLYECLSGAPPLAADSLAELAFQRTTRDAPPIRDAVPECPEALALVVDRCLARAPEDRFPSAARALWALDHPKEERAFALRRTARPPCVHCGAPAAANASFCVECRSDRPFRYDAGVQSVMLTGVASVPELLAWVADRFPERADPKELAPIAEACALLSNGPVRLVGGISDDDAAAIQKDLAVIGAHTKVERLPTVAGLGVRSALFATMLAVLLGGSVGFGLPTVLIIALGAPLIGLLTLARRASAQSLLGRSSGVHVASKAVVAVMGAAVLSAPIGATVLAAEYAPWLRPVVNHASLIATALSVLLAAVAYLVRSSRSKIARRSGPEPSLLETMLASFGSSKVRGSAPSAASRALAGVVFAIGVSAVIPVELYALSAIRDLADAPLIHRRVPAPRVEPERGPTGRASTGGGGSVSQPVRREPRSHLWLYAAPLVSFLALLHVLRRKRAIRADGERSLAWLDPGRLAQALRRAIPDRARARPDAIPAETPADGFAAVALGIASELAPDLDREDAARLWEAYDALHKAVDLETLRGRALEARCILETDPAQKLRFEFLELAGELEAKASASRVKP